MRTTVDALVGAAAGAIIGANFLHLFKGEKAIGFLWVTSWLIAGAVSWVAVSRRLRCLSHSKPARIWLEARMVRYQPPRGQGWEFPVSSLRLVAEYTNDAGPLFDDYFLVFINKVDSAYVQASFYADGRDEFLKQLGELLGSRLQCQLCDSVKWKSRIMWPPELEGQPLSNVWDPENSRDGT